MDTRKRIKLLKALQNYGMITIGSIITALSINVFMVPCKIAPGGVSGIATVIYYLTGGRFPVGVTMLAMNIPLFIIGMKLIGKRFFFRTLYSSVALSAIIDATYPYTQMFVDTYLTKVSTENFPPDLMLYSLFGGVLMGIGLGIVFRSGATTGGTDLAARIVNHIIPRLTMGQVLLIIDTSVIIFASIAFKSFQLALYAIVTLYSSSKVVDAMLEGVSFARAVFIISNNSEEVAGRILTDLDRGVTVLKGKGMYTGTDREVLFCVLHRGQIPTLKEIVKSIDKNAFITLADVREVLGEGFKTYDTDW